MRQTEKDSGERGSAVIEGALVLLLLFTLVFAIWEAGRLFNVQEVVTNAAREGARLAVAPDAGTLPGVLPTDSEVQSRVNDFLAASSIPGATVTINDGGGVASPIVIDDNEFTKVRVQVNHSFLRLPIFGPMLDVTVSGESVMRNETSP